MPKKSTANVDQNFIDMLAPVQTFDVMGAEIKARPLTIADFGELKVTFKDWQSFDIAELYNESRFDAFAVIVWIGTRDDTPQMKSKATADKVINMLNFQAWMPVFTYISGVEIGIDAADDLPPEPESEADAARKNA